MPVQHEHSACAASALSQAGLGDAAGEGGGAHLLVDDKQAAQRDAVGREHVVARRDLAFQVRDQRVRQVAHAALVPVWRARRALVSEICQHDACRYAEPHPPWRQSSISPAFSCGTGIFWHRQARA